MTLCLQYKSPIFGILGPFLSTSFTVYFTEIPILLTVVVKKNKKVTVDLFYHENGNEKANEYPG